ncbi:MAG: hypothetical protein ABI923_04125 [bacterium]
MGFNEMGESINEGEIGTNREGSSGLSLEGHHPEKDGISACLRTAEAVAARGASLTNCRQ